MARLFLSRLTESDLKIFIRRYNFKICICIYSISEPPTVNVNCERAGPNQPRGVAAASWKWRVYSLLLVDPDPPAASS